jgi:glycosyltransferase involved in cell wall biosynthesis
MSVSLLIPCFNASAYLADLAESIRAQQVPFDEVLCYDDGSSDDTLAVAQNLGLPIAAGGINRGVAHARNELAHRATGEWLHFQDADDPLLPEFLAVMRPLLSPDIDVAVCDTDWVHADTRTRVIAWRYPSYPLRTDPLVANLRQGIGCNTMIVRRSSFLAIGGFDATLRIWEDADLHIRLAAAGARYCSLDAVAAISLRRTQSLSHDYRASWGFRLSALERYATTLPARVRPELAAQAEQAAAALCHHRDFPGARRALALNHSLGGRAPTSHHPLIRALRRLAGPWTALRVQQLLRSVR